MPANQGRWAEEKLMSGKWILTMMFLVIVDKGGAQAQQGIIVPGSKLEKLAGDFKFAEGPAVDAAGNVYFTDQPNDRILKWGVDGKLSTYLQPSGRSNGMRFDHKGNLISCADMDNQLWSIDPAGKITVLVKDYDGKLLNGPNDVWVAPDDSLFFTDPLYPRSYWTRSKEMLQDGQHVYFLSADRKILKRVATDFKQPNGIIGSPDGKNLYISDIGAGKTFVYDIGKNGELANKRLFCELGSDGMTRDEEGNIYLTGKGVSVFDKDGRKIQQIAVDEAWTGNITFGGADRRTLFITASKGFYGIRMRVKGAF
jgi:gluconolactonase